MEGFSPSVIAFVDVCVWADGHPDKVRLQVPHFCPLLGQLWLCLLKQLISLLCANSCAVAHPLYILSPSVS